ncbi:MAG TPA: hypothetical protein VM369_03120 [Candidatus Binatia bacterium]|nr:hypothetical protein [Candidatus Binatia bacterium]
MSRMRRKSPLWWLALGGLVAAAVFVVALQWTDPADLAVELHGRTIEGPQALAVIVLVGVALVPVLALVLLGVALAAGAAGLAAVLGLGAAGLALLVAGAPLLLPALLLWLLLAPPRRRARPPAQALPVASTPGYPVFR